MTSYYVMLIHQSLNYSIFKETLILLYVVIYISQNFTANADSQQKEKE